MTQSIMLIVGTRPEGIKMMPIYFALQRAEIPVTLCSTMQHDGLLSEVFDLFKIKPDFELNVMVPGQDLFHINQKVLEKTKKVFEKIKPSLVLVQGDTTTTMASAMTAFYLHIPIGHVEAGLRTQTIDCPFPEEMNRRIVSMLAQLNFAPTALAAANLLAENIDRSKVFCTGNTVVDALRIMEKKINQHEVAIDKTIKSVIQENKKDRKKIVLLTVHRRESFNGGIERILSAIKKFASERPDVFFFYPCHPNPNVLKAIKKVNLDKIDNIFRCNPITYKNLVYILLHSDLVASDSGGICEEAVSLGKPTLILRNETERVEAIWEGIANLVGTDEKNIFNALCFYLDESLLLSRPKKRTIFGDGYAAEKIVTIIKNFLDKTILVPNKQRKYLQIND